MTQYATAQLRTTNKQLNPNGKIVDQVPGFNSTLPGAGIVLLGDSTVAYNNTGAGVGMPGGGLGYNDSRGHFTWLNALLDQRFNVLSNAGVNGDTTALILARIDRDVIPFSPPNCLVQAGINDVAGGSSAAATFAGLKAIYNKLMDNGIRPIIATVAPVDSAFFGSNLSNVIPQVNNLIRDYASATPGIQLLDTFTGMVNPDDANGYALSTAVLSGQAHQTSYGAYLGIVQAAASQFNSLYPPVFGRVCSRNNSFGTVAASTQMIDNPGFFGSGGSTTSAGSVTVSGTVAAGWEVIASGAGGPATAVCSVITNPTGGGYAQKVVLDNTGGGSVVIQVRNSASIHTRLSVGDTVYGASEINISAITGVGLSRPPLLDILQNGAIILARAMDGDAGLGLPVGMSYRGTIQSNKAVFTTALTDLRLLAVSVAVNGIAGCTFTVSRAEMRKVV